MRGVKRQEMLWKPASAVSVIDAAAGDTVAATTRATAVATGVVTARVTATRPTTVFGLSISTHTHVHRSTTATGAATDLFRRSDVSCGSFISGPDVCQVRRSGLFL